ncbi:MAG: LolA-like protein [Acidimicrobiales bacterium]
MAVLAACGGGGSGSGAQSAVDAAVNATRAAGSVRETVSAGTPTASGTATSTADGTYSFAQQLGGFTVNTGAEIGRLTVVLTAKVLYIRVPAALLAVAPKGKAWISAALDNPPTVPGVGNLTTLAGGADPVWLLEALQHASTKATKVGSATVNGGSATQYRVEIDLSRDSATASVSKLVGGSKESDDVFVDPAGRLARVVAHVALPGGATGTITVDLSGYGIPVAATLPPRDQVIDARQLLGQ